jgi:hypothetical protein
MVRPIYIPAGNFKSLFNWVATIPSTKASTIGEAKLAPKDENSSILFLYFL